MVWEIILTAVGSSLVIGFGMFIIFTRFIMTTIRKETKSDQFKAILNELGIKKFDAKELGDLTDIAFQRLCVMLTLNKQQTSTSGYASQIQKFVNEIQQMNQLGALMSPQPQPEVKPNE